jgi:hypothetical protein
MKLIIVISLTCILVQLHCLNDNLIRFGKLVESELKNRKVK